MVDSLRLRKPTSDDCGTPKVSLCFSQKYILRFLNICYFIFFIPFRFSSAYSLDTGFKVELKKNRIQSVFCIINHGIILAWCFKCQYDTFVNKDPTQKQTALDVTMVLLGPMTSTFFIHTAWTKAEMFRWLLEADPEGKSLLPSRTQKGILEYFHNILSIICPFSSLTFYLCTLLKDTTRDLTLWENGRPTANVIELSFFGIVILSHLFDVILQIVVLVFRDRLQYFLDIIASDNATPDEVLPKFYKLKEYVFGINKRFKMLILCSTICAVPFYSKKFGEIFLSHDSLSFTNGITNVIYFVWIFLCLIMAASVNRKICEQMKDWLQRDKNYSKIPSQELTILVAEISPDSFGLRGGNYFTLTYQFVGTVVSLIITYAFIEQQQYQSFQSDATPTVSYNSSCDYLN
ncbi:hypothetical protein Ocin01_08664 [Orchesella cincta]|uniref:Uncharacterized protein n=1 Tax=Orchesella cincta TaxID=48709 RepID=A0A1D2MYA0_ORCCI|nr:hypothetical protein Ocin01_08664 [Orchesella cincta]